MKALLIKLLSNVAVQNLIITGLESAAKRSDNTIDDRVIQVVRNGFNNRVNPIEKAVK